MRTSLLVLALTSLALAAPANAAVSIRTAEKACVAAAKADLNAKTARAVDQDTRMLREQITFVLRLKTTDGEKQMADCAVNKETGEVDTLEVQAED